MVELLSITIRKMKNMPPKKASTTAAVAVLGRSAKRKNP